MSSYDSQGNSRTGRVGSGTCALLVVVSLLTLSLPAWSEDAQADGGMIPYEPFTVYEPGQKAILCWNGTEEVMILSVDVYGSKATKGLHMVPFPDVPVVYQGNVSAFEAVEELTSRYDYDRESFMNDGTGGGEGPEMIFHDIIGAHDITAVRLNSSQGFVEWVEDFLEEKGVKDIVIPEGVEDIVDHYIAKGDIYFAFDVVDIAPGAKSVDPLIYRFRTDALHFPLHISSMLEGYSEIELAVVTPEGLVFDKEPMNHLGFEKKPDVRVKNSDLVNIEPLFGELVPQSAKISMFRGNFSLPHLDSDVCIPPGMAGVRWGVTSWDESILHTTVDVNHDSVKDVLVNCRTRLFAIDGRSGEVLWSVPNNWGDSIGSVYPPEVADLDGDGTLEVVIRSWDDIRAFDAGTGDFNWEIVDWFEDRMTMHIVDLDGDGKSEVVVIDVWGVSVLDGGTGTFLLRYNSPSRYNDEPPLIADIDSDPAVELVILNSTGVHAIDGGSGDLQWSRGIHGTDRGIALGCAGVGAGTDVFAWSRDIMYLLDGETGNIVWSTNVPYNSKSFGEPMFADVTGDGVADAVALKGAELHVFEYLNGTHRWCHDLNPGGGAKRSWKEFEGLTFADADGDAVSDVIASNENNTYAFSGGDGSLLWRRDHDDDVTWYNPDPIILDIDRDGEPEVVQNLDDSIIAMRLTDGAVDWKFRYRYHQSIDTEKHIGDMDGDGFADILVRRGSRILVPNATDPTSGLGFWNGEYLKSSFVVDLEDDGTSEVLAIYSTGIYCLSLDGPGLPCEFTILPAVTAPGGNCTILAHLRGGSGTSSGAMVSFFDECHQGRYILPPADHGNGFYSAEFSVPQWPAINYTTQVSMTLGHAGGLDVYRSLELTVVADEGAEEMTLSIAGIPTEDIGLDFDVYPAKHEPGSVFVFITATSGAKYLPGVDFAITDGALGGDISRVTAMTDGYYYFTYTAPSGYDGEVTLYILATKLGFANILQLIDIHLLDEGGGTVGPEDMDEESDGTTTEEPEAPGLYVLPHEAFSGENVTVIIGIPDLGDAGLNYTILLDDGGAGGEFTEPAPFADGLLSCVYSTSRDATGHVTITGLVLITGGPTLEGSVVLTVIPDAPVPQVPDPLPLAVTVECVNEEVRNGDICILYVYVTCENEPVDGAALLVDDDGGRGSLLEVSFLGDGIYYVKYRSAISDARSARIRVTANTADGSTGYGEAQLRFTGTDAAHETADEVPSGSEGRGWPSGLYMGIPTVLLAVVLVALMFLHTQRKRTCMPKNRAMKGHVPVRGRDGVAGSVDSGPRENAESAKEGGSL